MCDIEEIPNLPDQSQRVQEVTVDCYNQAEELSSFEVYFTDAMRFPFPATWRDPDEPGHAEPVTVLDVAAVDERRGVLLNVKRGDKQRRLLAEQVWA
ncbi:MAG: calcium-binding protein, partial [Anaerolineae bacterium]